MSRTGEALPLTAQSGVRDSLGPMHRVLARALVILVLGLAACARQAPPPNSSPEAKPVGDESQRQSQRADDQKAADAAARTTR